MTAPVYPRLVRAPRGNFFLFGVRGVGKSTWVRENFPQAYVVDLLDESRYQQLTANPALLAPELRTVPRERVVVLDEVQRVPALLNQVHSAIERDRRRFALLGSSARRLRTAGTNLLAGRATVRTMYPLVPAELGSDFDLDRVLRFGSIPLVWGSDDPRATLDAYVNLYVKEEVRGEALVRNLPGLLRFLPAAGLYARGCAWALADARAPEVDFVLRRGREHLAIEVESSARCSADQLAGLRAIAELPRLARRVLVYSGERSLKMDDGIEVWPFDRFARALAERKLWP